MSLFTNFWEDKRLSVKTAIQPGVSVEGNTILVEILLNNLLTNAIRYSDLNSSITVSLAANSLCIANSGKEPLKQEHLFKRFSSTSSQTPGTGLGLALVKQICNRYQWEIDYRFEDRRHIFTVHF
jgi:signal transduction histidine kinase